MHSENQGLSVVCGQCLRRANVCTLTRTHARRQTARSLFHRKLVSFLLFVFFSRHSLFLPFSPIHILCKDLFRTNPVALLPLFFMFVLSFVCFLIRFENKKVSERASVKYLLIPGHSENTQKLRAHIHAGVSTL